MTRGQLTSRARDEAADPARSRGRVGADLRLLPPGVGLWAAEAGVLMRSGQAEGPDALLVATWIGCGALAAVATGWAARVVSRGSAAGRPNARNSGAWRILIAVAIGVGAGSAVAGLHALAIRAEPFPDMVGGRAVVSAQVVSDEYPQVFEVAGGFGGSVEAAVRWRVRGTAVVLTEGAAEWHTSAPVVVEGSASDAGQVSELLPGTTFRVDSSVRAPQAARRESARLVAQSAPAIVSGPRWWQRWADSVREALRRATAELPEEAQGLIPGLAVGDEGLMPRDLPNDLRDAGMSHLTAVSGSNLAVVAGLVLLILRALRIPRGVAAAGAGAVMTSYVLVVGFEPSVVRAAAMGGIALLGLALGRRRAGMSALLAATVLLLMADPWLALSWGFGLSVAATAGILWRMGRAQSRQIEQSWPARFRFAIREALLIAGICQVATAPLVLAMGQGVSAAGVLANAAAAPAVPFVTILGLGAALVGLVFPQGAAILAAGASPGAQWIAGVARRAADMRGAVVPWPTGLAGGVALLAAMGIVALVATLAARSGAPRGCFRDGWGRRHGPAAAMFGMAVLAAAAAFRGSVAAVPWPPAGWVAVFCDVGQGDATVVSTGVGHAMVVDTGPEPTGVDRCLSDLGVTTIDVVVLTHYHADHVEGLPGALRRRSVGRVIVSPLRDPPAEARRVDQWLAKQGSHSGAAAVGEDAQVGAASYRVLWPAKNVEGGSAANNSSVTIVVRVGDLSLLLPGDIEPEAQQALIDANPPQRVDVIKIPHHGSRHQDPDLVAWSGARVAVASVGARNTYGHPAPATLAAWRQGGSLVFRTDRDGDVAVWRSPTGEILVQARDPAPSQT